MPASAEMFAQSSGSGILEDALTPTDWLQAGIIMCASIVLAIVVANVARRVLTHWVGPGFAAVGVSRLAAYLVFLVGLFYALTSLDVQVGPLIGAIGLGGLVLALALQKLVENFLSGLILQARRPFKVGDTALLGDHLGIVTDIDSRTTVLRGLDNTIVRLPNSDVAAGPIVNLTYEPLRRSELEVGVAYDTNLQTAAQCLTEALGRVQRVKAEPAAQALLTRFGASSIDFTLYYWHDSDVPTELATRHDVILSVHQGLAATGITIAFPQMVVWSGHNEDAQPYRGRSDILTAASPPDAALGPEPALARQLSRWRVRINSLRRFPPRQVATAPATHRHPLITGRSVGRGGG
ncbi:mechanosensitive ion channel family protein [Candidatus Poriferisocius sp.]|uniref:mechanosensitive ion channel family protein n=1 Tax=Candidatus Poriferisocius sp. TaxID=3101276 RepID=UPI003B5B69C0